MHHRRDLFRFFVVLLLVTFFGTQSLGQSCELDFHLESSSVMLLPGDNASVLCDASCFGREAGVHAVWHNAFGRQVGSQPSSVFSVRYNYGLMNRIMVIRASEETAGTYICSLMRNGEVVQYKPMSFVLLGSNGNVPIHRPEDTGPRRGDIIPESDIDYRPVRSVDRALSRVDTGYPTLDQVVKQNNHLEDLGQQSLEQTQVTDDDNYLTRSFEKINQIYNRNKQSRNIIDEIQNETDLVKETTRKDLLKPGFMNAGNTIKRLFRTMNLKQMKSDNLIGAQKVRGDNSELSTLEKLQNVNPTSRGYLRVRRQATEQSTTEDTTSANLNIDTSTEAGSGESTSLDSETQSSDMPYNYSSQPTNRSQETTAESRVSPTDTTKKVPMATTSSNQDYNYEESSSAPCQGIPSNFGRYGVLAFSVTLSVAFLLLYAILMIIFMPKILARRKEKSNIETGAYRRTGPDTSDTAPLAVLESSDTADDDVAKQETTNVDYTTVQKNTAGDIKKEEASVETAANVSSFLVRQNSEKTTDEPNKGKETTEESKANHEGNNSPQSNNNTGVVSPSESNHLETPAATPPANLATAETSTTQQSSDFLGDFRISDFMSATGGQPDVTNSADGSSKVANSTETVSGKRTGAADDSEVDLLPPPPPEQNNV